MQRRRRLGPGDIGRRVVVRSRLADGRATDVLGELTAITAAPETLVVRDKDGISHNIPVADVVAAKPVPPPPNRR